MRILFLLLVLAALYIAADSGMFDSSRTSNSVTTKTAEPGDGPAERLGATIDQGIAGAGRAVQSAGKKLERAADGPSKP